MHPLRILEVGSCLKRECDVANASNDLFWCFSIVIGHVRVAPVDYTLHEHVRCRILIHFWKFLEVVLRRRRRSRPFEGRAAPGVIPSNFPLVHASREVPEEN